MVQKAIQWSKVRSTTPQTLVGASGLVENMIDMVAQAWEEIQVERKDWFWNTEQDATGIIAEGSDRFFLKEDSLTGDSINKISGRVVYDLVTGAASIEAASIATIQYNISRCTVRYSEADEVLPKKELTQVKWDAWPYHTSEAKKQAGAPKLYSIAPDGNMVVYPVPDKNYRLYFRSPRVPQVLALDNDEITVLPEWLHKGVVWRGVLNYGLSIQDANMIEMARVRYAPYKKWLERDTMEIITLGNPGTY